jgi:hypothetical protein
LILPAVTDADKMLLLGHLAKQSGEAPRRIVGDMPFHIICCHRDNRISAVVCFLNYRRTSMEFHVAVSPGGVTVSEIRQLFSYPFEQLGVLRLWSVVRRNHKAARSGAERLGFKVQGVAHDEFGPGKDGILYSMRRADCPWLKRKVQHGR